MPKRIYVVTGGSDGLGFHVSRTILTKDSDAHVVVLARDENNLQSAVRRLEKYGSVDYVVCDVSNYESVSQAISEVILRHDRVDALINNAGRWLQGDVVDNAPSDISQVFATNALGVIFMTKAVLPMMRKQGSGVILNVVSIAGVDYEEGFPVYVSSKHAVRAFSESIRRKEASHGIKVMSVYPAGINTDLFIKAGDDLKDELWMMRPEDVANIIWSMLSLPEDIILNHVEVRKFKFN